MENKGPGIGDRDGTRAWSSSFVTAVAVVLLASAIGNAAGEEPAGIRVVPPVAQKASWRFEVASLILPSASSTPYLSLDDLRMYAAMPSNAPSACLEQDSEGLWQLVVRNAHNYHTEREQGVRLWHTRSAAEAAEPAGLAGLPMERTGFYALRKKDMPITILIPEWGLLQISAFNERKLSAVLHYKRVVKDQPKPAAQKPPAAEPNSRN